MDKPLEDRLAKIEQWTNFNYQRHVLEPEFVLAKVNHFQNTAKHLESTEDAIGLIKRFQGEPHFQASPLGTNCFSNKFGITYAYPNHYSQNKLNQTLKEHIDLESVLYGYQYTAHSKKEGKVFANVTDEDGTEHEIECKYLVGADGVKSRVRENLGI